MRAEKGIAWHVDASSVGMDSFRQRQISQSDCETSSNCGKKNCQFPEKSKISRKSEVWAKASKLEHFEKPNWTETTETFLRKFLAIGSPENEIRVFGPMKSPQCIFYAVLICVLVDENVTLMTRKTKRIYCEISLPFTFSSSSQIIDNMPQTHRLNDHTALKMRRTQSVMEFSGIPKQYFWMQMIWCNQKRQPSGKHGYQAPWEPWNCVTAEVKGPII